jgi:hypothetical protein
MAAFTSTTTIKVGEWQTRPMKTLRGVRQRDSLSPLLFNMEMEMAVADDITILSDHEVEVPLMLGTVEEFLR